MFRVVPLVGVARRVAPRARALIVVVPFHVARVVIARDDDRRPSTFDGDDDGDDDDDARAMVCAADVALAFAMAAARGRWILRAF